jgi:hypothetical protein
VNFTSIPAWVMHIASLNKPLEPEPIWAIFIKTELKGKKGKNKS